MADIGLDAFFASDDWDDSLYTPPMMCGLAACAEESAGKEDKIIVSDSPRMALLSAAMCCWKVKSSNIKLFRAALALAEMTKAHNWHSRFCFITDVLWRSPTADEEKFVDDFTATDSDRQLAVDIAASTKATWWATNHHVGWDQLKGASAKLVKQRFGSAAMHNDDVRNVVRKMGHWVDTRKILARLGVRGLAGAAVDFPEPSKDLNVKCRDFPAGTAKVRVCLSIVSLMLHSPMASVLPMPPGIESLYKLAGLIMANPTKYHTGGYLLMPGTETAEVDEQLQHYCAAYIHGMAPRSSLARERAVLPVDEVSYHQVYFLARRVSLRMLMAGLTLEDAVAEIKK